VARGTKNHGNHDRLRRDGQRVSINADQVLWIHAEGPKALIHFVNGDEMDVDETVDSVTNHIRQAEE